MDRQCGICVIFGYFQHNPIGVHILLRFRKKLPERCIRAATPEVGSCAKCGKPWERIVKRTPMVIRQTDWGNRAGNRTASSDTMVRPPEVITTGFRSACSCGAPSIPALVLDLFAGSGTTLLVSRELGRRSVGLEISEEYCSLASNRLQQEAPNSANS